MASGTRENYSLEVSTKGTCHSLFRHKHDNLSIYRGLILRSRCSWEPNHDWRVICMCDVGFFPPLILFFLSSSSFFLGASVRNVPNNQSVKCFLPKYEDLGSDPRHPRKNTWGKMAALTVLAVTRYKQTHSWSFLIRSFRQIDELRVWWQTPS